MAAGSAEVCACARKGGLELPCRNSQRWRQALKDLWVGGEEGQCERWVRTVGSQRSSSPGLRLVVNTRLQQSVDARVLVTCMCHSFLAAVL